MRTLGVVELDEASWRGVLARRLQVRVQGLFSQPVLWCLDSCWSLSSKAFIGGRNPGRGSAGRLPQEAGGRAPAEYMQGQAPYVTRFARQLQNAQSMLGRLAAARFPLPLTFDNLLISMKWHGKKVKRTHDSSKYGPDFNESQTKIYCSNRSGFPDGTERQSAEAFFKRKGRRGDPPVQSTDVSGP